MAQNAVPVVADSLGLDVQRTFLNFLQTFAADGNEDSPPDYLRAVEEMKDQDRTTLYVDYNHLLDFDSTLAEEAVAEQFYRFDPYLRKAVQNFVKEQFPAYVEEENGRKEFFVAFVNMPVVHKLRELKTEKIGSLSSFSATVTRTSEVRPELLYGAFNCMVCGTEVKDVEQQCKYTTPAICPNPTCNNRKNWKLSRDNSKFVDWQRVRVQENADEVPAGSLPRSMDVILRHETVEHARAGDKCIFTGSLMVVPDTAPLAKAGDRVEVTRERGRGGEGVSGLRSMGVRELHYRMVFLAHSVVNAAASNASTVNVRDEEGTEYRPSEEELAELEQIAADPALYDKLVQSVAPAVYGHADIKRAVLLMLFGGVHKTTFEGIQLRGDINVAIIGDPSCAKSQFLKYVAAFLPRAVYTSGKSSSAAGLTATVVKDPETGEYAIEAGALMLADNGICCIDEFDKMDPKDQVAIHEAMEQQTISIAKAGISATLNARTSILAAANPAGGRYDKSKPLKANLMLPPAILSRFDLVHIMVDEPDDLKDYNVAKHIVQVHQMKDAALAPPYTCDQVQRYIRHARSIKPRMGADAQREIVRAYARLRSADAQPGSQTAYRITVRQLEALVRLSEALARVDCAKDISVKHVREARRLLQSSIISVEAHDVSLQDFYDDEEEYEGDGAGGLGGGGGGDDGDGDGGDDGGDGGDGGARRRSLGAQEPQQQQPQASQGGAESRGEEGDPSHGGPSQTEGREGSAGTQPQQQQQAAQPQQLTVTFETFQRIKQLFALRLKEMEDEAEAARAVAAAATGGAAGAGAEGGDAMETDENRSTLAAGAEELAGCRQGELVKWYLDERNAAGAFQTAAEMAQELKLVKTIINHLIKKDAVLNVIETPSLPEEYEEMDPKQQARARAQQLENRKLALNPNYVF